jgi:hypothetical protein
VRPDPDSQSSTVLVGIPRSRPISR